MADYYTNFSVIIPLTTEQKEHALQLSKQVEAHRSEDQPLPADFPNELADQIEGWTFETEPADQGIWLQSQYGGQDTACVFVQHLLQKFNFAPFVAFEWSHDCSKPRTDVYGGGAAFVTAAKIETLNTSDWLRQRAP
jgi:hypothetical protein